MTFSWLELFQIRTNQFSGFVFFFGVKKKTSRKKCTIRKNTHSTRFKHLVKGWLKHPTKERKTHPFFPSPSISNGSNLPKTTSYSQRPLFSIPFQKHKEKTRNTRALYVGHLFGFLTETPCFGDMLRSYFLRKK